MIEEQKQEELNEEYRSINRLIEVSQRLAQRMSPPLLLNIPLDWYSGKRILVVGQETMGWDFGKGSYYDWPFPELETFQNFLDIGASEAIPALMHAYTSFEYARHQQKNYNSPFWRAYRQIRRSIGDAEDGLSTRVLWTNLFRISLDGGSVVKKGTKIEIGALHKMSKWVLRREIEILSPTAIVFYTGPNYDQYLLGTFDNANLYQADSAYEDRKLSVVEYSGLPKLTYRTYHPAYQRRSHQWELTDWICQRLKS